MFGRHANTWRFDGNLRGRPQHDRALRWGAVNLRGHDRGLTGDQRGAAVERVHLAEQQCHGKREHYHGPKHQLKKMQIGDDKIALRPQNQARFIHEKPELEQVRGDKTLGAPDSRLI